MKQWRLQFPVDAMCRVLEVSCSGFYASLQRQPSRRRQDDERLKVAIEAAHRRTRERYGSRRLQPELTAEGFQAGRDRIGPKQKAFNLA